MAVIAVKHFFTKYPMARGVLAYSITWPTGNLIQQSIDGKRWETYDWTKCAQFSLYGSCYVAPTMYGWIKLMSKLFPSNTVKTAIMRTIVEQLSYGPAATASFFFLMSLLEEKTVEESKQEVKDKFWPTYKTGMFYWSTVQTLNYTFIPERNRVPMISLFGLVWTTYLAYVKQKSPSNPQTTEFNAIPATATINTVDNRLPS